MKFIILFCVLLNSCVENLNNPVVNMNFSNIDRTYIVDEDITISFKDSTIFQDDNSAVFFRAASLTVLDGDDKNVDINLEKITKDNYNKSVTFKISTVGKYTVIYTLESNIGSSSVEQTINILNLRLKDPYPYLIVNSTENEGEVLLSTALTGKPLTYNSSDNTVLSIESVVGNKFLYNIKKRGNVTLNITCDDNEYVTKVFCGPEPDNNIKVKKIGGVSFPLRYVENFDTSIEDIKTRWEVKGTNDDETAKIKKRAYWREEALEVKEKALEMHIKEVKGLTYFNKSNDWIAGGIHQKEVYSYGYFEARIKMKKTSDAHWDAFWAYISDKDATMNYEFDMMEYTGTNNVIDITTHWWDKDLDRRFISSRTFHPKTPDLSQWVTLGLLWTPNKVEYYINDILAVGYNKEGVVYHDANKRIEYTGIFSSISSLELNKFKENKRDVIPAWKHNFKFTSELGRNYGPGLPSNGTDDMMIVDYFINYEYLE